MIENKSRPFQSFLRLESTIIALAARLNPSEHSLHWESLLKEIDAVITQLQGNEFTYSEEKYKGEPYTTKWKDTAQVVTPESVLADTPVYTIMRFNNRETPEKLYNWETVIRAMQDYAGKVNPDSERNKETAVFALSKLKAAEEEIKELKAALESNIAGELGKVFKDVIEEQKAEQALQEKAESKWDKRLKELTAKKETFDKIIKILETNGFSKMIDGQMYKPSTACSFAYTYLRTFSSVEAFLTKHPQYK